jgi:hypothetical protein
LAQARQSSSRASYLASESVSPYPGRSAQEIAELNQNHPISYSRNVSADIENSLSANHFAFEEGRKRQGRSGRIPNSWQ